MKNSLVLECERGDELGHIADAVYAVLGQTDKLRAEVIFVDGEEIKNLNRETRNIDKVTDVLSFPTLDGVRGKVLKAKDFPFDCEGEELIIGSIVLCEDRIREQAEELGHSLKRETEYLIVHGLMHLFGYDHMEEDDKAEMRVWEKKAMSLLGVEQ